LTRNRFHTPRLFFLAQLRHPLRAGDRNFAADSRHASARAPSRMKADGGAM